MPCQVEDFCSRLIVVVQARPSIRIERRFKMLVNDILDICPRQTNGIVAIDRPASMLCFIDRVRHYVGTFKQSVSARAILLRYRPRFSRHEGYHKQRGYPSHGWLSRNAMKGAYLSFGITSVAKSCNERIACSGARSPKEKTHSR